MTPAERNDRRAALIAQVTAAFAGVRLGDGIGLKEAQGHDDYESNETCEAYRREDEKQDWTRIPGPMLDQCQSSLSFFDPKGMRFHLPAYIVAHLRGTATEDPVFHLAYLDTHTKSKLALLSEPQKRAVEAYLWYLLDDADYEFQRPHIEAALQDYWMPR